MSEHQAALASALGLNPNTPGTAKTMTPSTGWKGVVVSNIQMQYNDEYYYSDDDAGHPERIFVGDDVNDTLKRAQEYQAELDAKYIYNYVTRLSEYDNEYGSLYSITGLPEGEFIASFNEIFGTSYTEPEDVLGHAFQAYNSKTGKYDKHITLEQARKLSKILSLSFYTTTLVEIEKGP